MLKWLGTLGCVFSATGFATGFASTRSGLGYWRCVLPANFQLSIFRGVLMIRHPRPLPQSTAPVTRPYHPDVSHITEAEAEQLLAELRRRPWWPTAGSLSPGWYITVPLWMPFVVFAAPTAVLWCQDRRRIPAGCCLRCGYDLTGNVSARCPECGAVAPAGPALKSR